MDPIKYIHTAFNASIQAKQKALKSIDKPLAQAAELAIACLSANRKIMICGNGGSAADAQHFAAELVGRFEADRRGLPAIALTTDSSALTAIANDMGYEQIFSRQLTALAKPGDVLIAISTSGNSENVNQAILSAHDLDMRVIALTGKGGGKTATLLLNTDIELDVPETDTARIQEIHILILHCLCGLIEKHLFHEQ